MDRLAPPDGGKKEELRGRLRGGDLLVWFLLVAGAAVMVFPLYWMFATAVRPKKEIFSGGFDLVPSTFVWSNFSDAWNKLPWDQFYINSIAIAAIAVPITVFINLLAGYTFAKYKFPGRDILFLLMVSIPDELIEAARLDGAGEFTIFRRVVLPLSWPVIAVLSIFTFMWRWNDFAWPLVVLQEQSAYTVPLGLSLMQGQYFTDWTGLMSMSLLSIIPMMLVFIFFQRYFIQGIASTGLK